jgi:hypothetical protein
MLSSGGWSRNTWHPREAPTRHPSAAGRLDSWQLAAFLASVRDDRFYPLCLMSATTGMRRSELSGLRLGGRGPRPGGRVSVAETRVVVPGQAQDSDGKTVHSRRLLSLDPSTVLALTEQHTRPGAERGFFGAGYQPGEWIFTWENGRPVHPDVVRQRFNRAVARVSGVHAQRLHARPSRIGPGCRRSRGGADPRVRRAPVTGLGSQFVSRSVSNRPRKRLRAPALMDKRPGQQW